MDQKKEDRYAEIFAGYFISKCKDHDDIKRLAGLAHTLFKMGFMDKDTYHKYVDELTLLGLLLFDKDHFKV